MNIESLLEPHPATDNLCMTRIVSSFLLVLHLFACGSPPETQLFEYERDIVLGDEVFLDSAIRLSMGPNWEILALDLLQSQVLLFEAEGSLIRKLDPESCNPGFRFRLLATAGGAFGENQIVVLNSTPPHFLFDRQGNCTGTLGSGWTNLLHQVIDEENRLVGIERLSPGEGYALVSGNLDGDEISSIPLGTGYYAENDFNILNEGFAKGPRFSFFMPSVSPVLFKVNGDHVERIPRSAFLDDVVPPVELQKMAGPETAARLFRSVTMNQKLFALDDERIFMQFSIPGSKKLKWVVMDQKNTDQFWTQTSDFHMDLVHEGFGYRILYPELDSDLESGNPTIQVYRYVGPS